MIKHIHHVYAKGSILVFLPGWDAISTIEFNLTSEQLNTFQDNPNFGEDLDVFCLHSQVNISKSVKVFRPAHHGRRKVILSTNIGNSNH